MDNVVQLKMLVLTVEKYQGLLGYVSDEELSAKLIQSFSPENAESVEKTISELMRGSTRLQEGIYPWDLKVIFHRMKVSVKFVDSDGAVVSLDRSVS